MADLSFGEWLKRRRHSLGLTQSELGRQAGYSGETMRKVEADALRPSRQMAERLADTLGIAPEDRAAFIHFARDNDDGDGALPALPVDFPHSRASLPELTEPPNHAAAQPDAPLPPAATPEQAPDPGDSPYQGLRFFSEADAPMFFGREALVRKLFARLTAPVAPGQAHRPDFLAVVGASGSGKSSMLRAGLIPALRSAAQPPRFDPIHVISPTAHPLEALAANLTRDISSIRAATTLMDDMLHDERVLLFHARWRQHPDELAGAGPATGRLLLVVDQFEELFTLCHSETERKAFIDNLMAATDPEADAPITVVIALRADFYPHCAAHDALRQAVAEQQEYIGPMSAAELRQAVELPAQAGGWNLGPGLADMILQDVSAEPGALPLLSHALLATWQQRRGRTLTLESYLAAGRVQGAIAETAEAVYQSLTPEEQSIARGIFLRLTALGEDTQDTRRRVAGSELLARGPAGEEPRTSLIANVLKTLSDARLITQDGNGVEVAHEALIREWPTLRQWLTEDRDGLRLHRHLTEAAQEWQALERDSGELYRGQRLEQARGWAAEHSRDLNALETEFLVASKALAERAATELEARRQHELEAARALAEAQRQRAVEHAQAAGRLRIRNRVITTVGILALLTAAMAGFFGVESSRNARMAEAQAATAEAASTQVIAQRDSASREFAANLNSQMALLAHASYPTTLPLGMMLAGQPVPAKAYALANPNDVAFDAAGNMYVSECFGPQVLKVDPIGLMTIYASPTITTYSGDGGPARSAGIACAAGLAFDHAGNLYIADQWDNRIRRVDPSGIITTFAGTGDPGPGAFAGDGGPATQARLWNPTLMAFDADDNLYFVDLFNNRVRKVDRQGIITTVAGVGTADFSGDGGPANAAQLNLISVLRWQMPGLAIDAQGRLYIADSENNRIRMVDRQGRIWTIAGQGSSYASGAGGPAAEASLYTPNGLAFDDLGNLYIATGDSDSIWGDGIHKVDANGTITTFAGGGGAGFSGDGGPATAAEFQRPGALRFDGADDLYIVDFGNGRVRKIDKRGVITTVAGSGQ